MSILDTASSQLQVHLPALGAALTLYVILRVAVEWRIVHLNDREFGYISEARKAELPLRSGFVLAVLHTILLSKFNLALYERLVDWICGEPDVQVEGEEKQNYALKALFPSTAEKAIHGQFLLIVALPMLEEILFRGPLLLFPELSGWACAGVVAIAFLFGWLHWQGSAGFVPGMLLQMASGAEKIQITRKQRVLAGSVTFGAGVLFGIAVVYFQSIWAGVLLHALWNVGASAWYQWRMHRWLKEFSVHSARCT